MKLRHAAALALVGWYLMVPPIESIEDRIAPNAHSHYLDWKGDRPPPLRSWSIKGTYATADECADALLPDSRDPRYRNRADPDAQYRQYMKVTRNMSAGEIRALFMGQCVASDDRRLKAK